MRYGFILLDNYFNINALDLTEKLSIITGNPATIYFRLVTIRGDTGDLCHDTLRFIPPSGTQAFVSFTSIDDSLDIINRPATQIAPTQDASIFTITIGANETFAPNSMTVTFNDGTNTYNAQRLSDIIQQDVNSSNRFFC